MAPADVLEIHELRHRFGELVALDDVTFDVGRVRSSASSDATGPARRR